MKDPGNTVRVRDVEEGEAFRKRTGTYRYMRLSESSVKWARMDTAKVWGACLENGNLTALEPDTVVALVPREERSGRG